MNINTKSCNEWYLKGGVFIMQDQIMLNLIWGCSIPNYFYDFKVLLTHAMTETSKEARVINENEIHYWPT